MKSNSLFILLLLLPACSSAPVKRTKFSDKNMRIMIDPASVNAQNHVRIQTALVKSDNWIVLDRNKALAAIKKEQEELHRSSIDRYEDKQKYAHCGKLYGVGAVIVAHVDCHDDEGWTSRVNRCKEYLNLVDANTGEVIVAVDHIETAEYNQTPEWEEVVEKLNAAYPSAFEEHQKHKKLVQYEQESGEEAQRQRETAVQRGTASQD